MMHKKSLLMATLLLSTLSPALLEAKGKKTYNISAFSVYQSLPVNHAGAGNTQKQVAAQFPGWVVTTDKVNGMFTDIYGTPFSLPGSTTIDKATGCMTSQLSSLGINAAEWVKVSEVTAPKADYANFRQQVNGHDVVFSRLSFRFTKSGMLARIQMKNYGTPDASLEPVLSAGAAKTAVAKSIAGVSISKTTIEDNWVWFPVPHAGGYTLQPAWHFHLNGTAQGSVPLKLNGYIDAITGEVLYQTNDVKETAFDVTIKGMVYPNGTLMPASLEPLPDLWVYNGADTVLTDTAGLGTSAFWTLPFTPSIPLAGKWSTVIDSITGQIPDFADTVLAAGSVYTYPTLAPSSNRHVNAYYHVNRVHNFMKGFYPTFTGMDFSLPTNVDLTSGNCNAFYDGAAINFYQADATCNSFAEIGDIIYHEYGHGISDHFYTNVSGTTIQNGALNEANSDIWALSITHNPVLGLNSFVGYGGFIRRYDLTPQVYPIDWASQAVFADPHENGQIIAGTWWDVALNLGSADSMTRLFTDVYYDAPDGPDGTEGAVFQSVLIDALMADDNNSNLMDGTPHYAQIVAAFAKHGLYLEGDATLIHSELPHQLSGSPIPVTATLEVGSSTYMHDLTMYYRANGTGAWMPVAMTSSGTTWTGNIPAQNDGTTVEYYFVIHDALNTPNAYFPITCNAAMLPEQTTIPYQFAVGVHYLTYESFQTALTGWHVGTGADNGASAGRWQQALPVPSPYAPFITAYPGVDHTTNTSSGKCLVTGSGAAGGFFGTSVSNGTTTVLTPAFDITGYTTPIVEYYRWFSNEQGGSNFKNDPWIVMIRDGSSTSNPWISVERTYQADVEWRRRIFPVSAYLPATTTMIQMKFVTSDSVLTSWDNNGQSLTVGGVDDFFIRDKGAQTAVPGLTASKASIYPNPADDQINIVLPDNSASGDISLYDMNGKRLAALAVAAGTSNYSMSTRNIAPGCYTLVIQTGVSTQTKNIVVTHR